MQDNCDELNKEEASDETVPLVEDESITSFDDVTPIGDDNKDVKANQCKSKSQRKKDKPKAQKRKKHNYWPLIITIITFVLSLTFSFVSELVTTGTGIAVSVILLLVLIMISIIFDGIGVSVTSCDLAPLNSMAARKVPHAKVAIMLVKNAGKVNNICADVIGDICGIVSGACGAALVVSIMAQAESINEFVLSIFLSAFIAALTVGGKAFEKTIAIKKSQQIVMMAARVIGIFYKPDKKRKKNARKNK